VKNKCIDIGILAGMQNMRRMFESKSGLNATTELGVSYLNLKLIGERIDKGARAR